MPSLDADGVTEFTIDKPGHEFEDPRLADCDSYLASITVEAGEQ